MRAPLYASAEFPNANPDLHAGFIDPVLFPDVEDPFGDGEAAVVDDLPELLATEAEIEIVGDAPHSPRDSMIRLIAAVCEDGCDVPEESIDLAFTSLEIPRLPPLSISLTEGVSESDLDAAPRCADPAPAPVVLESAATATDSRNLGDGDDTLIAIADAPERIAPTMPECGAAPIAEGHADAPLVVTAEVDAKANADAGAAAPRDTMVVPAFVSGAVGSPPPESSVVLIEESRATDAFARLVETIVDIAGTHAGATALLALMSGHGVAASEFGGTEALVAAGLAVRPDATSVALEAKTKAAAREWMLIVRDEGGDLEACGGKTLDEFCAGIAAALSGDASRAETMRRSLRSRGVAAYGWSDAA